MKSYRLLVELSPPALVARRCRTAVLFELMVDGLSSCLLVARFAVSASAFLILASNKELATMLGDD